MSQSRSLTNAADYETYNLAYVKSLASRFANAWYHIYLDYHFSFLDTTMPIRDTVRGFQKKVAKELDENVEKFNKRNKMKRTNTEHFEQPKERAVCLFTHLILSSVF